MSKNNFFLTTAFLIILAVSAKSQTDFRPGYLITNKMDTIQGLIDYRGEIRNSKTCVYKPTEQAEPVTYLPGQIHSYRFVDSKYYISKVANNDTVFLEYLVDGIIDLYFMWNDDKAVYYIEKEGKMFELNNDAKRVNIDGKEYEKNTNQFIGYLKYTLSDCMRIQPKLEHAKFEHKSLTNLTVEYNSLVCADGACVVYQKPIPVLQVKVAPMIGLISLKQNEYDGTPKYDRNIRPCVGLIISNCLPRFNEKISFDITAQYSHQSIHGQEYEFYSFDQSKRYSYYNVKFDLVSIDGVFSYTYPKGKIRPSMGLGFGRQLLFNKDIKVKVKVINRYNEIENIRQYDDGEYEPFPEYIKTYIDFNYLYFKKQIVFCRLSYCLADLNSISFNVGIYL